MKNKIWNLFTKPHMNVQEPIRMVVVSELIYLLFVQKTQLCIMLQMFPQVQFLLWIYIHKPKGEIIELKQSKENHYSYGMPSKEISRYQKVKVLKSFQELHEFIQENYGLELTKDQLKNSEYRDVFGDVVMILKDADYDVAVRAAGDFMLYYASQDVGEVKRLIKARDIWNQFVASNYKTAEPGLIFWSTMTKYSPSNYVGRPIASTNPCGEVPLESGGACNLGSVNLSRLVIDGFTENARINWTE